MRKIKFLALALATFFLMLFVGCGSPEGNSINNSDGGSSSSGSSSNNSDSGSSSSATTQDLQLLRIETKSIIDENLGYRPVSYANRKRAKKVNDSSVGNTGDNIEKIESEMVNLVAVIKNENRASFIDMVVYNSQTEKTVVYNEGNGAYQCSSETVYEDGMWVTNIGFSVNVELTTDTFYFETKEIKFLRNSADVQVDVNDENIRKKHLAFSDEYLTNTLLNKDFNIKLPYNILNILFDYKLI